MERISRDDYYMEMAKVAAQRADCQGTKVGAVVIVEDRIVSTGYNGAPDGVTNCSDGGCPRCAARAGGEIKSGADLGKRVPTIGDCRGYAGGFPTFRWLSPKGEAVPSSPRRPRCRRPQP
jgi:deoxycytidylate deaminase